MKILLAVEIQSDTGNVQEADDSRESAVATEATDVSAINHTMKVCSKCLKDVQTLRYKHKKLCTGEECSICKDKFFNKQALERHLKNMH